MIQNNDCDISQHLSFLKDMAQEKLELELTNQQLEKFQLYTRLLLEWNERVNLTAITELDEIMTKHFLDSLVFVKLLAKYYPKGEILLGDLGTGAGFPGIPVKILLPKAKIVLIDSLAKRINFLNEVIAKLQLDCVEAVHARAEEIGRNLKYRESFHVIVARAVAELPVLLEYGSPLLMVGGRIFAAKGVDPEQEIDSAKKALQALNCKVEYLEKYKLADGADHRSMIVIKKIGKTPANYPRQPGKPKKSPL